MDPFVKALSVERHHTFLLTKDWEAVLHSLAARRWGLIFVDQWPCEMRGRAFELLHDKAEVLVAHDTEPKDRETYKWTKWVGEQTPFKYRADYKSDTMPWASAFSNEHPWVMELCP
jgi:hypothetical protein